MGKILVVLIVLCKSYVCWNIQEEVLLSFNFYSHTYGLSQFDSGKHRNVNYSRSLGNHLELLNDHFFLVTLLTFIDAYKVFILFLFLQPKFWFVKILIFIIP